MLELSFENATVGTNGLSESLGTIIINNIFSIDLTPNGVPCGTIKSIGKGSLYLRKRVKSIQEKFVRYGCITYVIVR